MPFDRRLHPLSFLFTLAGNARNLILPAVFVLFAARSSSIDFWLLVLIVPYAAVAIVRYLTYRYRFAQDELVIRTGLVFRNERHIPYGRIHNVGSVQNILHRMFGVAEVRVETAGGQETEARLQVLSLTALEEMRQRVFEGKRQATGIPEGAAPAEQESEVSEAPRARTVLRLTPRDLIVSGIVDNRGMVVAAAVTGIGWEVAWQLGWLGDWGAPSRDTIKMVMQTVFSIGPSRSNPIALLAAVLLILVALRVLSIGWAFIKLHGFTLTRSGDDLSTTHGLLTRLTTTIPLKRMQVLTLRQRPLQRLFDRMEASVDTAGGGSAEEGSTGRHRIAPLLKNEDLPAFLCEVHPGADLEAVEWTPVDPRAWRRIVKWTMLAALGAVAASVRLAGLWGLVVAPLVPFAVLAGRRVAASMAWAVSDGVVYYRSGWLWRHVSMARHPKIQALQIGESPFDRRWGMASLLVDTAGASGSHHRLRVPYLARETARSLMDRLSTRAARTEFQW